MNPTLKSFVGEFIGTFIIVFIGCGAIGVSLLYAPISLVQMGAIWGFGVFLAIVCSMRFSNSHLNPAVSFGFLVSGGLRMKSLPIYLAGQLIGAFAAAGLLYAIFANDIALYENVSGFTHGGPDGYHSAMIFGCYYPNPGFEDTLQVSTLQAFIGESAGTAFLMAMIYFLSQKLSNKKYLVALGIGLTITLLIILIAPHTQAGFNPARDFAPRLLTWFAGWKESAFSAVQSPILVYVIAPIAGTVLVGALDRVFTSRK